MHSFLCHIILSTPALFSEFGWEAVLTAGVAALVTLGGAITGWYLLLREKRLKFAEQERNMTVKERAAARRERLEDERSAKTEVWELYEHMRSEAERITAAERECNKRLARLEAVVRYLGVNLDDFTMASGKHWDDDSNEVPTTEQLKKEGRLKPGPKPGGEGKS